MRICFFLGLLLFYNTVTAHQTTDVVVMVSPDDFKFNYQTSSTNSFQHNIECENIALNAHSDFNRLQEVLRQNEIHFITLSSRKDISTPDAVFPNNWFSVHEQEGKTILVLYPMLNANRQAERQVDVLKAALMMEGIHIDEILDLTHFEMEEKALEGTGALVLDHVNKIAYASISPRMHPEVLDAFAEKMGYTPVVFSSTNATGSLIYHTNVMMSVGSQFAVLCKECIKDPNEAERLVERLTECKKTIIYISLSQMSQMCGNILEVKSQKGKAKIIMSDTAYTAFSEKQINTLQQFGDIVHANIQTIEIVGGGSARCMLAEIFYHLKKNEKMHMFKERAISTVNIRSEIHQNDA